MERVKPTNAEATFVRIKDANICGNYLNPVMLILIRWLSHEYPCSRVSVIFSFLIDFVLTTFETSSIRVNAGLAEPRHIWETLTNLLYSQEISGCTCWPANDNTYESVYRNPHRACTWPKAASYWRLSLDLNFNMWQVGDNSLEFELCPKTINA